MTGLIDLLFAVLLGSLVGMSIGAFCFIVMLAADRFLR